VLAKATTCEPDRYEGALDLDDLVSPIRRRMHRAERVNALPPLLFRLVATGRGSHNLPSSPFVRPR
jgi:hypothetical protein